MTADTQPANETKHVEMLHCEECGHDVHPVSTKAPSVQAGIVVTLKRCPGCEAAL